MVLNLLGVLFGVVLGLISLFVFVIIGILIGNLFGFMKLKILMVDVEMFLNFELGYFEFGLVIS